MDTEKILKSTALKKVLIGFSLVVLLFVALRVGVAIGYHKARFAGNFNHNFERNFMGQRGGMKMIFSDRAPGGHGAVGKVVSINLPEIVVAGPDNFEKTVVFGTTTLFRKFQEEITSSEIKEGDFVVVLGNPNEDGKVEASLLRIMPEPERRVKRIMPR